MARVYEGASLVAMARLAGQFGYALVACESRGVNALFVRGDLAALFPRRAGAWRVTTRRPRMGVDSGIRCGCGSAILEEPTELIRPVVEPVHGRPGPRSSVTFGNRGQPQRIASTATWLLREKETAAGGLRTAVPPKGETMTKIICVLLAAGRHLRRDVHVRQPGVLRGPGGLHGKCQPAPGARREHGRARRLRRRLRSRGRP